MFTAFTSSTIEKVKKGLREEAVDTFCKKNRNSRISSNVNSKADLSDKPYNKSVDLSAYG
jgi:hypothetical protein